jgi:hypothetical protein
VLKAVAFENYYLAFAWELYQKRIRIRTRLHMDKDQIGL